MDARTGQPGAAHRHPHAANARRCTTEDRELPAPAADPADPRRQEHEQQHPQPDPGQDTQP
ncbi:predicted protein [Streptomyces viridosporus ATCC 14672]|uniref:Predicted protein n=1 Tax=Streptomyces viridosporus (strain ATCC 14672 / DSM 40746 / JCM 4963 / KCTC 9882 / NRRL B-12104 / FH 1290) TaxID=566461 RepID=D6A8M1_STRV1|nr:predicted protein [Streptomyces viridosporus ATCC 14672]